MEQFKLDYFKEEYGFQLPVFTLNNEECARIFNIFCKQLKCSSYEKLIDGFNAKALYFEKIDIEKNDFSIFNFFNNTKLKVPKELYINWNKFDKIDGIQFKDFNQYFFDIWYPISDDIEIFDSSFTWIIMIRHDGLITYCRNPYT